MDTQATESLAESLRKGQLPDAQAWEVSAAVQMIADAVARPAFSVVASEVRKAAQILNEHRHFDHTRMLGESWHALRPFDPVITKHHAQALIDLLALDAGEQLVRQGLRELGKRGAAGAAGAQADSNIAEYEGLLGRIYKQRFVLSSDMDHLVEATRRYRVQYQTKYRYWHGINVAALLARQERQGIAGAGAEVAALAQKILDEVTGLIADGEDDPWVLATASEACLALKRCDEAELWLYRFLHHPGTLPFHMESYGRQIREIWQGDATRAGNRCADRLAGIMARHTLQTQRRATVSPADIPQLIGNRAALEKNFSGEGTFSVDAIQRLLGACASIGCVSNLRGERLGTGFLVAGKSLAERFAAGPVFVTNAHVISEKVPNAIAPGDARVSFELEAVKLGAPKLYKVEQILYTSPPADLGYRCPGQEHLDLTIATLEDIGDGFAMLGVGAQMPLVDPKTKAYVIGHPRGAGLQISLNDSVLLDVDDDERLMHYRTPTDPGSSGSPVFNSQLEVIAVHHGGSRTTPRLHGSGNYEANEGITLSALRRKLK